MLDSNDPLLDARTLSTISTISAAGWLVMRWPADSMRSPNSNWL
ncbi:Uncharacterised protein [Mycobacteroides abscessus subsp. abscessus]|nr:Uncharacterised protein [Mycobacteroides abscessus subsp. abscessus]